MVCQVCHRLNGPVVCARCRAGLVEAHDRVLPGGIRLVGAFEHQGPARPLIHNLKYRGVSGYPDLVAESLAPRLPRLPLVPIPRALTRRLRYGVDPTHWLAETLARRLGVEVLPLLRPPVHSVRRAGGDHSRPVATFRLTRPVLGPVMIVDDVVTTGATLLAAVVALGTENVVLAVAANVVSDMYTSGLSQAVPSDLWRPY